LQLHTAKHIVPVLNRKTVEDRQLYIWSAPFSWKRWRPSFPLH